MENTPITPASLKAGIKTCMLNTRGRLFRRINGAQRIKNNEKKALVLADIAHEIMRSQELAKLRLDKRVAITYPAELPVTQAREKIAATIAANQVVIIAGETGSGKTTQIPKICMEMGRGVYGSIGHTQPRRIAARAVANRIASELGTKVGDNVGYKVRFNDQVAPHSQIKLMTDGILLAEIQHDKYLNQYDTIIIDEAHERSLNIDFILGYLKNILPKRKDLKVIITSATIDPARFAEHFNDAPIIEVSGRTYPVEVRYRPQVADEQEREQIDAIIMAIDELSSESMGDILIFMHGERDIRETARALEKLQLAHTQILPLYARLTASEQNLVFQSHTGRRIVLATNVAETSLTVPGIKYVIDPGMARISRYSYRTKVQRLPIEPISQASANQRKGRCGRVAEGICIRLYSEDDFYSRAEFTQPEILRTNLASVILQMKALDLGDIAAFPFVEPPEGKHINDGVKLLEELGALGPKKQDMPQSLSKIGWQLVKLPIDPRLARMVIAAAQLGVLKEVIIITTVLSIQDPREVPQDKQQQAKEMHGRFIDKDSDFISFLNLWNYLQGLDISHSQFRKRCKREYINYMRVREWQELYKQVSNVVRELGFGLKNTTGENYEAIHQSLLTGMLSRIGLKDIEKHEYQGARNARFSIFPGSALFKKQPKWIMVAELVETSKLWGRVVAKISPEWVEPLAQHLLKRSYSEPHWEKKTAIVSAFERVTVYGVPIIAKRKINYGAIDPTLSREIFIRSALVEGQWEPKYKFFKQNLALMREVEELEHKSRRRDILIDDETMFEFYDQRIGLSVVSGQHFAKWWKSAEKAEPDLLNFAKSMLLKNDASHITELDYPNFWHQGALKLKLTYQFEPGKEYDGVTVHIPLPILNQIENKDFDWQIPALREELIIGWIKSLPKPVRRSFVPAPNYAKAFLARCTPFEEPLLDALERHLCKITGVRILRENWQSENLASHLKINFKVVDHRHKTLGQDCDLDKLKASLQGKVQATLTKVADDDIEQTDLHKWTFGDLPKVYTQNRGGYKVKAYPAIVDSKNSVAVKLFASKEQQLDAMQAGLRRLVLLNVPSPIKYLHQSLPNKTKLGLYFNHYGKVLDLIDDCIACAVDKLILDHGGLVFAKDKFEKLQAYVAANLNETVVAIAKQVELILNCSYLVNKRLKGRIDLKLAFAMSNIKAQLDSLIYPGFVTAVGALRLADILRYVKAIDMRIEKLAIDPNRDRAQQIKLDAVSNDYKQFLNKFKNSAEIPVEVQEIRWMLEELRVSYFAQQLGTKYPISDKRIRVAMDKC